MQMYSAAIKYSAGAVWAGGYWVCLLFCLRYPTLILSGARVGGGAFMSCNYCINRTPFLSAASPSTVFPFSRSCATLSSEAACDSVFSVTRRRGEGKMERGENRHAGRSLHNITGVTCSRSQPHTNKQFLELNQAHILCMPTVCRVFWRSQNKKQKKLEPFLFTLAKQGRNCGNRKV